MKRNAVIIAILQTFLDLISNPGSPIKAAHIERTIAERSWMERVRCAPRVDDTSYDALEAARADPGSVIVDVYDWVGLDEIVGVFQALIAQARS